MKGELLKRLFRAIASSDTEAIEKLSYAVIEDERRKGHTLLAQQLENIQKKAQKEPPSFKKEETIKKLEQNFQSLTELPTSKRSHLPLVTVIPREKLRHHMVLPDVIEKRFQRIEREYAARDRLAHYGLRYRQRILFYGSPGCGKTLGAERLAWNTGLPLLKVRFDAIVSSFLGETANNLRLVFEQAASEPCVLFFDECDSLAKSREDSQEVGEMKRVVNTFLQILDEYEPTYGLLIAATNLNKSLDMALWRRFDDLMEIPKPGEQELIYIIRQTLSTVDVGSINWSQVVDKMSGFSSAQAVRVAEDAAKRAILDREGLVIQEHLMEAIQEAHIFQV